MKIKRKIRYESIKGQAYSLCYRKAITKINDLIEEYQKVYPKNIKHIQKNLHLYLPLFKKICTKRYKIIEKTYKK